MLVASNRGLPFFGRQFPYLSQLPSQTVVLPMGMRQGFVSVSNCFYLKPIHFSNGKSLSHVLRTKSEFGCCLKQNYACFRVLAFHPVPTSPSPLASQAHTHTPPDDPLVLPVHSVKLGKLTIYSPLSKINQSAGFLLNWGFHGSLKIGTVY